MKKRPHNEDMVLLYRPGTGNVLTLLAAISFQFMIIVLPLVGPAGAVAPHARLNFITFLGVLLLTMALSALAFYSKVKRRALDASGFPYISAALLAGTFFFLFALFAGLFRI